MAEDGEQDLTLGQLLTRSLASCNRILSADSPNDQSIQSLLLRTLSDLQLCSSLINHLSILSSKNETLEEVSTRDLRCFLVEAMLGQLHGLVKTKRGIERMDRLKSSRQHFKNYLDSLDRYQVIPQEQRGTFAGPAHQVTDPNRRRESKIAQYKMEKEIKGKLEELRKRRTERRRTRAASTSKITSSSSTDPPKDPIIEDEDDSYDSDTDSDEIARPLFIQLLLQNYVKAHSELSSIEQEIELLEHGMKMSDLPSSRGASTNEGGKSREGDDESTWRLDKIDKGRDGPMLDPEGKVLRPFTILPSSTSSNGGLLSTRLRLQSEVFRTGHRLPTMTIDEFLDQEREQGNILQGGGPGSSEAVEQARKDEQGEKEEDTVAGYLREEQGLKKARDWDEYRDEHRKGEGNM